MLIHAGAGGVGTFAVQLAKARGAHVITTVGPRNVDFVKQVLSCAFALAVVSMSLQTPMSNNCIDVRVRLDAHTLSMRACRVRSRSSVQKRLLITPHSALMRC